MSQKKNEGLNIFIQGCNTLLGRAIATHAASINATVSGILYPYDSTAPSKAITIANVFAFTSLKSSTPTRKYSTHQT